MDLLNSSWGVELVGSQEDIDNLFRKLNGSIRSEDDFFVSKLDDCFVLRTARWDAARDSKEASQMAGEDLGLLNSCIEMQDAGLGLTIGTIFFFQLDGKVDQSRSSGIKIRVRIADQSSPTAFKNLVDAARSSDSLRLALSELTPDHGWFEIFKALESLKRHYGGESSLFRAFSAKAGRLKLMKRTANSYRHAAKSYELIRNPMDIFEARKLIKEMMLNALSPSMSRLSGNTIACEIPDIHHLEGHAKFGLRPLRVDSPDGTAHSGDTIHAPE